MDNIVWDDDGFMMNTNTEYKRLNWTGMIPGYNTKMWHDKTGVATILSFTDILDQFHVTYDNSIDDKFHVRSWKKEDDDVDITFD